MNRESMESRQANRGHQWEGDFQEEKLLRFLTFYINEECFAFNMDILQEIIWVPQTIKVPLTPPSFLGLTNLRGSILPLIDLRILFEASTAEINDETRAIIIQMGTPIGVVVDRVDRVFEVREDQIERANGLKESSANRVEYLEGVIKEDGGDLIQIIDIEKLIKDEFLEVLPQGNASEGSKEEMLSGGGDVFHRDEDEESLEEERQIITFFLQNQEFGFEIERLKEIIRYPEEIHAVPESDPSLMGVINYRNQVLPLLNMGSLIGLPADYNPEQSRVLVMQVITETGGGLVGFVVESVHEIVKVKEEEWSSLPELISHSRDCTDLKAICKLEKGKRIVSVFSLEKMSSLPGIENALSVTEEIKEEQEVMTNIANEDGLDEELQLVTFTLADQEYGIFIDYIQEIILVPEQINIVPKTPDYIEGMINLRGAVLPVIDMRKRLGQEPSSKQESQRIIVLNIDGIKTGFIVDCVTEVLSIPASRIEVTPKLSEDQAQLMDRVINLEEKGRIILIINAEKLLSEEEMDEIKNLGEDEGL